MFSAKMAASTSTHPYCRLCALKSESFIDVFHRDGIGLELVPKIKQCLQVIMLAEDVLPKTICLNCCEKVLEFSDFFSLCSKSQDCLIDIFSKESNFFKSNDKDLNSLDFNLGLTDCNSDKASGSIFTDDLSNKLQSIGDCDVMEGQDSLLLNDDNKTDILDNILGHSDNDCQQSEGEGVSVKFEPVAKSVWMCATCDQDFPTLANLRSHHMNVHQQPAVFKCHLCFKVYTRYRSFSRHFKTHTDPNKYSCSICYKGFSQKTILQTHMAVHSEVRPHVCVYCGKSFKQFSSLYLHSKCHIPDKDRPKYQCLECEKSFNSKTTLDAHIKVHRGERNFICDVCGKRFFAKNSLDYHIATHNDDKPHDCPTCGKCFKTRRLLTKHINVHSGIKPHQCDVCGKQFRERCALKEHSRIHTGAMPYSCEFCGKLFRFKGILTVHRRLHTGERPYSCEACRRGFTNWANYNKHMKRRHKDTSEKPATQPQPPVPDNLSVVEPPSFDSDLSAFTSQQFSQSDSQVYRVSQYTSSPSVSIISSYYLPLHSALPHDH